MDDLFIDSFLPLEDTDLDEAAAPEEEAEEIEEKMAAINEDTPLKLDYTLKTMEERAALVDRITREAPPERLTPRYLEILGDYIMQAVSKEDLPPFENQFCT